MVLNFTCMFNIYFIRPNICGCLSSVSYVNSEAAVVCHRDNLHNETFTFFRSTECKPLLPLCDGPPTQRGRGQCVHHLWHCHGEDRQTLWSHILLPLQGLLQTGAGTRRYLNITLEKNARIRFFLLVGC